MRKEPKALFCDRRFRDYRQEKLEEMKHEISTLSRDELEDNSTDFLTLIFTEKYSPPNVKLSDPIKRDGGEVEKDVSHRQDLMIIDRSTPTYKTFQRLEVVLKFNVKEEIFRCRPSSYDLNPPLFNKLRNGELVYYIDYTTDNREPEEVSQEIQNKLEKWNSKVEKYVQNLNNNIESMRKELGKQARSSIEKRRSELDTKQQIMDELGVQTQSKEPRGFVKPEKKRNLELSAPSGDASPPGVPDKVFIDLLEIIEDIGINIERSAERVRTLDEQSLRDIFLAGINSHFKGLATGETFNKSGKTDILLRHENNNIFVAECKFWTGKSSYTNAIDQLLEYLTVRDTHASLLIFSNNTDFDHVRAQIKQSSTQHPHYRTELPEFDDHDVFEFTGDSGSTVKIAVQTFNLKQE